MSTRSTYKRQVKDAQGNKRFFRLRLLKCPDCGALHAEIPDCIKSFKHYSADVIEQVLSGELDSFPGDYSTVYRWKKKASSTHTLQ